MIFVIVHKLCGQSCDDFREDLNLDLKKFEFRAKRIHMSAFSCFQFFEDPHSFVGRFTFGFVKL